MLTLVSTTYRSQQDPSVLVTTIQVLHTATTSLSSSHHTQSPALVNTKTLHCPQPSPAWSGISTKHCQISTQVQHCNNPAPTKHQHCLVMTTKPSLIRDLHQAQPDQGSPQNTGSDLHPSPALPPLLGDHQAPAWSGILHQTLGQTKHWVRSPPRPSTVSTKHQHWSAQSYPNRVSK